MRVGMGCSFAKGDVKRPAGMRRNPNFTTNERVHIMRLTQLSMALAAAITASSAVQAQQFSEVISFGDSLTDAGNVGTLNGLPPDTSFTTNQDPVYSQILSSMFGLGNQTNFSPLIPGSSGSNYAYGGACAISNGTPTQVPGLPFNCVNSPGSFSLMTQFTTHLAANGGVADPNALYTYWAGANDILSGVYYSGLYANPLIAQAWAGQAGATAAGEVAFLQSKGAKTIVVFNLPDLGKTPLNVNTPNATGATALTTIYNLQFEAGLANASDGIVAINTFAIINEVTANPTAFGFTNTTGKACPASSLICGPASAGYPTQPSSNTYLFADDIHPSGKAHALLANVVYATITAPGIVSLAPEVAMQSAYNHSTAINDALDSEWASGSEVGKIRGFTAVQFGQMNIDATGYTPELDADSMDLNIGATYRVNEGFTFGVAATLGSNTGDSGFAGEFDGTSILLGLFGQYEINGLYGRLSFSAGNTDMDISRRIDLGASTRTEIGNTGINQQIGALEVGYVFKAENFTHGPFGGVEINNNEVEAYVENGNSSTAMRFDDFSRDSNMTTLGYQFSGKFGGVQPFARVAWVTETNTDQTFVRGGTASMPGNFSLGGYAPTDDSFIDWNVGASMSFAESFDGFLSYRGRNGNDQQDNGTFSLGVRKTF
jgi:outer membrane lipase/esterase